MTFRVGVLGAVDSACPSRKSPRGHCRCGICVKCGFPVHSAVHMHAYGEEIDGAPYHHRFASAVGVWWDDHGMPRLDTTPREQKGTR